MYRILLVILLTIVSFSKDVGIGKPYEKEGRWFIDLKSTVGVDITNLTLDNGENRFGIPLSSNKENSIVYFLIDSSSPMKKPFQEGIKPLLKKLYNRKTSNEQWIVSTFDLNLKKHYDETKTRNPFLPDKLDELKINGKRTELWKNSEEAINDLKNLDTDRKKILVICSDGDSEDKAYKIETTINEALKHNITILSLGYRDRGTKKTNFIQNMERVAKDTYGKFWLIKKDNQAPIGFIDEYDDAIGHISTEYTVELPTDALIPTLDGKRKFDLTVKYKKYKKNEENEDGTTTLNFLLDVPKKNDIIIENISKPIIDNTPLPKEEYTLVLDDNTSISSKIRNFPVVSYISKIGLWESILLSLLLLALIVGLILFFLEEDDSEKNPTEENDPLTVEKGTPTKEYIAYFESLGGTKHYVHTLPSTIGSKGDVVINGQYISKEHAILKLEDGYFIISDIDSKNGLFVNGVEVKEEQIKHNDKVSFGPYDTIFMVGED